MIEPEREIARIRKIARDAMEECVKRLRSDFADRSIYAFIVSPVSGFCGAGHLASSRESLARRLEENDPEIYGGVQAMEGHCTVCACEWAMEEKFPEVDQPLWDALVDLEEMDGYWESEWDWGASFTEMFVELILEMKAMGGFSGAPFEEDVLLGIQHMDEDPAEYGWEVSARVNSSKWHEQLYRYYGRGIDELS